jgi:hypothetical protein
MTTPDQQDAPALVPIFLTNGTMTTGGPGPGVVQVPPEEAAYWIGECLAVAGQHPPAGYLGPYQAVVSPL